MVFILAYPNGILCLQRITFPKGLKATGLPFLPTVNKTSGLTLTSGKREIISLIFNPPFTLNE